MKFCPNCGNKLKPRAKFCEKCGHRIDGNSASDKLNSIKNEGSKLSSMAAKSLKNVDTSKAKSWLNKGKNKWYVVGVVIILLLVFGVHMKHNGGSLFAPKNISFAQQLKDGGTHIWYYAEGTDKDAIVDDVDVLKHGKMVEYQIFNDNITLGKLAKMNNHQIISLAKEQDKKYFNDASGEIKNCFNEVTYNGLMNDIAGSDEKAFRTNIKIGTPMEKEFGQVSEKREGINREPMVVDLYYRNLSTSYYHKKATSFRGYKNGRPGQDDVARQLYSYLDHEIEQRRIKAALNSAKHAKYMAPKLQSVSLKSSTDDSGNNVVSQTIDYKGIDMFDEGLYKKTTYSARKHNQKLLNLIRTTVNSVPEPGKNGTMSPDEIADPVLAAFSQKYFNEAYKGLVNPNYIDQSFTFEDPVSQTIYNKRYIGYHTDDCYFLTKAQTKDQKATFPKPNNN